MSENTPASISLGSWASLAIAATIGAGLAAGSAYYMHMKALELLAGEGGSLRRGAPSESKRRARKRVTQAEAHQSSGGESSQQAQQGSASQPGSFDPLHSHRNNQLGSRRMSSSSIDRAGHSTQSGAAAAAMAAPAAMMLGGSFKRPPTLQAHMKGSSPTASSRLLDDDDEGEEEMDDEMMEDEDEEEEEEEDDDDEESGEGGGGEDGGSAREKGEGQARMDGHHLGNGHHGHGHGHGHGGGHGHKEDSMTRSRSIPGDLHGLMHAPDPLAADLLRKEPEQETFARLEISPLGTNAPTGDEEEVCHMMQQCLAMRDKYVYRETTPPWRAPGGQDPWVPASTASPFKYEPQPASEHVFSMVDGVVHVYANKEAMAAGPEGEGELFPVLDATTFFTDLHRVLKFVSLGTVRTLCYHRLRLLEQKFNLHLMLNADREFVAQKSAPHRDFYNVRKVDTHVHHSACMNQKHLLRFIKSKLRKEPDELVIFRDGKYLTLREVFESLDLTGYDLNVDLLDVHADKNTFHRFDRFNLKYNPCGQSRLREIFIKQDNLIQGRFLAELTKEVFTDLAASKYQMAEYRISVYGRKKSEWDQLAAWIVNNELHSDNVVWLIQLPRLYSVYREMGIVQTFQTLLDNVFVPLFEVTIDPASHPHLHIFLKYVVGFDMVDDESKPERRPTKHMPTPGQWDNPFNPAYSYWAYYVYANLYTLNKLRESKGMSIIKFRPHSGEAGDIDHLAATFLLAHNIAHGNNLRKSPGLQYLYYLAQIGLAMSPLSNNSLFLDYHRNPFPMFFSRGMNVSLSTDDPLQIHLTKEPLVEEYSIAAQVWKLSSCDLCEIARNSVYQSGFTHSMKAHWVGDHYWKKGPDGNDIHKTNVPHMRVEFRHEVWLQEMQYVFFNKFEVSQEIHP